MPILGSRIQEISRCALPELEKPRSVARFEGFEFDLRSGELRPKEGSCIRLSEQPFRILTALLEQPGKVVLREEIRKTLWPNDTVVEFEHSINAAMKRLRQALGDSAENPHYVDTLARRGYRWMVAVEWVDPTPARPGASTVAPPESSSFTANLIGKKVSHYRVLEILGGGGMGVIYKAEDLKLGRRVALKFLPEEVASEPSALERFEREARAASALDHPNICAIHEFGEHDGQPFIVMQLLEGHTLRERIGTEPPRPGKPLPTPELLEFAIQITRGLEAAHQKGIIHRDIKPANIFITHRGEAKILDFGVAKLLHGDADLGVSAHSESPDAAQPFSPASPLNLTRTGTTVGTASYMSPEQILGEKLDARTDLFSFGLVLHEMATGQQAFAGDTAVLIRDAILHRSVQPARQLNPQLPAKLDEVIAKVLEKDRDARYQTASEVRVVLETLQRDRQPRLPIVSWRKIAAGLTAALLVASTAFWLTKRQPTFPPAPPEQRLRELTFNSEEKGGAAGLISPDGKYLAYGDVAGLHIQLVETNESLPVSQPEALHGDKVNWDVAAWFPDSTRVLVNSHPSAQNPESWDSQGTIVWLFSVAGGEPRRLRDNADAYSVSPDSSLISFGTNKDKLGDREIWLMGPDGQRARMLYAADNDGSLDGFSWSRDSKRVMYVKTDDSGSNIMTRDLSGGPPIAILSPSEAKRLKTHLWLPDGRLLYSLTEDGQVGSHACNLWQMRLDARSGRPIEKPTRLTNWPGACLDYLSATADGARLVFRKSAGHITTSVADLDPSGSRIANTKHFTLTDSWDIPEDWTADSKAILFVSNRTGYWGIYKQALSEDTAVPLVPGTGGLRNPRVSADGNWVLYLHDVRPGDPSSPSEVRRVPIAGGSAAVVSTARPGAKVVCAKSRSDLCAIAEPTGDGKQMVVTAFDPMKGPGRELTRFALDPGSSSWIAELSPDGTRIAALQSPEGPIRMFSLSGQATQEIALDGSKNLRSVHFLHWDVDGRGLFVSDSVPEGGVLLHLDLQGNAQILWKNHGVRWNVGPPSPDGRHLAIMSSPWEGNLWMMENF